MQYWVYILWAYGIVFFAFFMLWYRAYRRHQAVKKECSIDV